METNEGRWSVGMLWKPELPRKLGVACEELVTTISHRTALRCALYPPFSDGARGCGSRNGHGDDGHSAQTRC